MLKAKLSLATMQGKLSRDEMKLVKGGVAQQLTCWCNDGNGGFSPAPWVDGATLVALSHQYCGTSGCNCTA